MKIVKNNEWGGFTCPLEDDSCEHSYKNRNDPKLVEAVENGLGNALIIVEIPDNSYFTISDYDGIETVYYSESPIYST